MVRRPIVLAGLVAVAAICVTPGPDSQLRARAGQPPASPPAAARVDTFTGNPRLVVLSDIGNEPDDQMSLVRLLTYSNEIDIEGLVATTSTWQKSTVHPETMHELIAAYGEVRPNLLRHAVGWPEAKTLDALVAAGQPAYGMAAVGPDKMSPGAEILVRAGDRDDPRPLWVSIWGGANTLAQALVHVRATRTPEQLERFVAKLRVYSISDQDDAGPWMRREFPGLFYIVKPSPPNGEEYYSATWIGISGEGYYRSFAGADRTTITNEWLDVNIRSKGPLGKHYPKYLFIMEGDTPSFLGLTNNGLNSYRNPGWGGWGGRYIYRTPYGETRPIWTQGGDASRVNSQDGVIGSDGQRYSSDQATIWRWREAYQHDFAARMDWTVKSYAEANHNPVVIVNGQEGTAPIEIAGQVGHPVMLDASAARDPDGNQLRFNWFHYAEAGAGAGPPAQLRIDVADTDTARAWVTPTAVSRGRGGPMGPTGPGTGVAHIILAVTDNGSPGLTSYRRVILSVSEGASKMTAGEQVAGTPAPRLVQLGPDKTITEADCTAAKLGSSIPRTAIGEPVSSLTAGQARKDFMQGSEPSVVKQVARPQSAEMRVRSNAPRRRPVDSGRASQGHKGRAIAAGGVSWPRALCCARRAAGGEHGQRCD